MMKALFDTAFEKAFGFIRYLARRLAGCEVAAGELRILESCVNDEKDSRYYLIDYHHSEITLLLFSHQEPPECLKNGSRIKVLGNYRGTEMDSDTGLVTRVFLVDPHTRLAA